MSEPPINTHPGHYVRSHVLPEGMSVTQAAKTIGVGRPALSNFLNGNASLSPEMAMRLQKAFGADPDELMRRQAEYEASQRATNIEISMTTRTFVPPFLDAVANDIETWASAITSRSKFAVLLRILVNSTCEQIHFIDFPGNDDAQRPGWDGRVETHEGNPWVPKGSSGWEFGTSTDIKKKANEEYAKRTEETGEDERKNMSFVFVTPRRWPGREAWLRDRRAEGKWRDVFAWDASSIEQWMEQSIAGQAWFGNQRGLNLRGVKSLENCWVEWCADCKPHFTEAIFNEAIESIPDSTLAEIRSLLVSQNKAVRVIADSREEGLAFLHVLLSAQDNEISRIRDRTVVFTEVGPLSELAVGSPGFIPIITQPAVEKEFAQSGCALGRIVIEPRTAVQHDADITLDLLSNSAFVTALNAMELDSEEINRLERESGRSLTVLRRRLAQSPELRSPSWSSDEKVARTLFPLMLVGAWKTGNEADQYLLCELTGIGEYAELEQQFTVLQNSNDSPVWSIGGFQGVVSKIDSLYAVHRWVTEDQIRRFLEVADLVLSERDPTLDLPKKDRWAGAVHGKVREISAPLRKGIAESLVLLSIHGPKLIGDRIDMNIEHEVAVLIRSLLEPMSTDKLLSQSENLPLYAEASPDQFLSIMERDIASKEPVLSHLMTPTHDALFERGDRVDLLWALELLAWRPKWLHRVVALLATLSEIEPDDNLANKPSASLASIFRSWVPQTAAPLEHRIAAFERLAKTLPEIAWKIAIEQFRPVLPSGDLSNKPIWRDYALGHGEPVPVGEARSFVEHCKNSCLDWPTHTRKTLKDLLTNAINLSPSELARLESAVTEWAKTADDRDRALLREHIRVSMKRKQRRASKIRSVSPPSHAYVDMAQNLFSALKPEGLIWEYAWLFKSPWIQESWDDIHDDTSLEAGDRKNKSLRRNAICDVLSILGYDGVLRLGFTGNAPNVAGTTAGQLIDDESDQAAFAKAVLDDGPILTSLPHQSLLGGFLCAIGVQRAIRLIDLLSREHDEDVLVKLLCLSGFEKTVWNRVHQSGDTVSQKYWASVNAVWRQGNQDDIEYVVQRLLDASRPIAALDFAHLDLKHVKSELIHRILTDLSGSQETEEEINRLEKYSIQQAFEILRQRNALSQGEMAKLEFVYLDLWWHDEGGIPNLERHLENHPEVFCEAISLRYKSIDSNEDNVGADAKRGLSTKAYKLLDMLTRIPGQDEADKEHAKTLKAWVQKVQELCDKDCRSAADYHIGKLLSRAPEGKDGVWPCEPVREVLEDILNENILKGFQIGRHNLRGFHERAEGGLQERELSKQYEEWAKACDYSYPKVATALRGLADDYKEDARWHDRDAAVQRRIGY